MAVYITAGRISGGYNIRAMCRPRHPAPCLGMHGIYPAQMTPGVTGYVRNSTREIAAVTIRARGLISFCCCHVACWQPARGMALSAGIELRLPVRTAATSRQQQATEDEQE